MTLYNHFIGLDMGKFHFVVAEYGSKKTHEYENNAAGIQSFLQDYESILPGSLCVLETTGGYEMDVLYTLCSKKVAVHRADARKVKNFIRSFGDRAKTDILDAQALAWYGYERSDILAKFVPSKQRALDLYELAQRRNDLKQMLVAEKNRNKGPRANLIKKSWATMIRAIEKQIQSIDTKIAELIEGDEVLKAKKELLKTIPGIGNIVASDLLILLPELGSMDRRKVASLAGLAPRAHDSGKFSGYRRTGHGRNGIKSSLFLAAMAARNSNSRLKDFYLNLIAKGKKKMVALMALMRKILVIANAKLKPFACA